MRLQYFDGLIDILSTDYAGRYLSGNNSVWINIEGGMLAVEMNDKIQHQPVLTRDSHCNNKNIFLPKIFELHLIFENIWIVFNVWVLIKTCHCDKRQFVFDCKYFELIP